MHRVRVLSAGFFAVAAGAAFFALPHNTALAQQTCGESTYSKNGVVYRVLFAKNRAVQQYDLQQTSHNTEQDHDVLVELEAKYGPAQVNAPPVRIISFRAGGDGMTIPEKIVDSCGRVSILK